MSAEESDIISKVYELSFDQAGCRMIQQRLEENYSMDFVSALVTAMTEPEAILPEVMAN